jgi:hypothetical protein
MPRNLTSTLVEFWRMKTINRISSTSATPVATQAALVRVTRGARGAVEEPASDLVVGAGPSPVCEEGGSVVMIATFLSFVMSGQREPRRSPSRPAPIARN